MSIRSTSASMSIWLSTAFRSTRSTSAFTSSEDTTSSTARAATAWARASKGGASRSPIKRSRETGSTGFIMIAFCRCGATRQG